MPVDHGKLGWFSPDPRGVVFPHSFRISRSLRKSIKKFTITTDQAFAEVLDGCADPSRPNGWINRDIKAAYLRLHQIGWAHSVEVWADSQLVGGVYGLAIGSFFAGESMFHRRTDASKAALAYLVNYLKSGTAGLLDVQWLTPHLESLGAVALPRMEYVNHLTNALAQPNVFTSTDP